jgi:hypothetical protein
MALSVDPSLSDEVHTVLHSIIEAGDRRGVDRRTIEGIAVDCGLSRDDAVDSVATLLDAHFLVRSITAGSPGLQVTGMCNCTVAPVTKKSSYADVRIAMQKLSGPVSPTNKGIHPSVRGSRGLRSGYDERYRNEYASQPPESGDGAYSLVRGDSEKFTPRVLTKSVCVGESLIPSACEETLPECADDAKKRAERAVTERHPYPLEGDSLPWVRGSRIERRRGRSPGPDTSVGLALRFQSSALDYNPMDLGNMRALAAHLAKDKKSGVTPDQHRDSFDRFFLSRPNKRVGAWKLYVARRQALLADSSASSEMEAHRYDRAYWGADS